MLEWPVRIAGIDPSTKTGFAALDRGGFQCTKQVHFADLRGCARLQAIANCMGGILEETKPDLVYIEGYGFKNQFTLVCMVEVGTMIRMVMHKMGIQWCEVAPTKLKLWTTGSGAADKKKMAASVQEKWQFSSKSNDVVDAFALAQFGLAIHHDGFDPTTLTTKRKRKK